MADKQLTWSTKKVDEWMKDYANGIIKQDSPWADGNIGIRKPNIVFEYTPDELQEIVKCANDILYFAEKYCWCMQGSKGYQPIKLREYQKGMLSDYTKHRFNVVCATRQIGKTVTAGIFLLHNTIFSAERNIGIAANKFATAVEIVDKIKEMMSYLPFFLKPGVVVNNQATMAFDNGCRIIAQATTKKSFIGFTIHTLYLDEFAHVESNVLDTFYENIMPTVSSMQDSKIIVTSTPNGCNKFYDIFTDAQCGRNSYHPIRVDWWQVPGRDEEWHQKMIADCGGEDEFMRQYGNSFLSTGNMLLTPESLKRLQECRSEYVYKEIPAIESYYEDEFKHLVWHPDFNVDDLYNNDKRFIIGCDIAEGGGKNSDYTVFQICEVVPKSIEQIKKQSNQRMQDLFCIKQVGMFRSNTADRDVSARMLYLLVMKVLITDNTFVVLEYNTYGAEMMRALEMVYGDKNEWSRGVFVKYKHNQESTTRKPGIRLNGQNKSVFCVNFRGMCSNKSIEISESVTVQEAEVFSKVGNTYKAAGSKEIHDDTMMSMIDLSTIMEQHEYYQIMYDLLDVPEHKEVSDYFYGEFTETSADDVKTISADVNDMLRKQEFQNSLLNKFSNNNKFTW